MITRRAAPLGALAFLLPALAACGGDGGTGPNGTPASIVKVEGDAQRGPVGEPLPTSPTVEVRDASGDPVSGVTVSFAVEAGGGSVSPDSPTTDASGRASVTWTLGTSTAADQRLRATAGGASATFTATAEPGPPAEILKSGGDDQIGDGGQPLPDPLEVRILDGFGNPVPGVEVAFSAESGSLSPGEATTDSGGRASTTFTLPTAEQAGGSLVIAPSSLDRARATLAYEETLEGARSTAVTATTGGLGSVSFATGVRLDGSPSFSVTEGATPAGIGLSSGGVLSGTPSSVDETPDPFTVKMTLSASDTVSRAYELPVCPAPTSLSPGQSAAVDAPGSDACGIFLPAGSSGDLYRVTVLWPTSQVSNESRSVTLSTQRFATGGGAALRAGPTRPRSARIQSVPGLDPRALERALYWARGTERRHAELRREEEELVRRVGPGAIVPDPVRRVPFPAARAQAPQTLQLDLSTTCGNRNARTAVVLAENEHVAIYQDSTQRATEPVDPSLAQDMLDYYRDHGKQVIDDYFGGVRDINDDGRVNVVISPEIADGVAAFVWSGDFLDPDQCASSNEMELIYFNADVILDMNDGVFQALGTLVHEAKHVSSLYQRLLRIRAQEASSGHPLWMEEGTADIAANVSSRIAWAATGGPAVDATVTASDFQDSGTTPENWGVVLRMARIASSYSVQPNALTTDDRPDGAPETFNLRGPGWLFHRWLGDAYFGEARADSAFFREQNDSASAPGVPFIEAETGKGFATLLDEYAVALGLNGSSAPGPARPFTAYDLTTAAEIFCSPNPLGVFPWPVTLEGSRSQGQCEPGGFGEESFTLAAPFETAEFSGPIGAGGLRVHDFESDGTGQGIEINVEMPAPGRAVVVRLQ